MMKSTSPSHELQEAITKLIEKAFSEPKTNNEDNCSVKFTYTGSGEIDIEVDMCDGWSNEKKSDAIASILYDIFSNKLKIPTIEEVNNQCQKNHLLFKLIIKKMISKMESVDTDDSCILPREVFNIGL